MYHCSLDENLNKCSFYNKGKCLNKDNKCGFQIRNTKLNSQKKEEKWFEKYYRTSKPLR